MKFKRQQRLRTNRTQIAAKLMDGEVIIIHLITGTYYNTDNVGAWAWMLISQERPLGEIISAIAKYYSLPLDQVESDVFGFVEELMNEGLVEQESHEAETSQTPLELPAPPEAPYTSPRLAIYRDMADLLALDPPMPVQYDVEFNKDDRSLGD